MQGYKIIVKQENRPAYAIFKTDSKIKGEKFFNDICNAFNEITLSDQREKINLSAMPWVISGKCFSPDNTLPIEIFFREND